MDRTSNSNWKRETEVVEICGYFERLEKKCRLAKKNPWQDITARESQIILKELERCRKDFSYAARNYFWIVDKSGEDVPFRLWESQELILEKWYWMRDKFPDRAQKMMILKARQLGAIAPDTLVLRHDFRWVRIRDINPGERLISVDENPPGGSGAGRKFRVATVFRKWSVIKKSFKINFSNGRSLIVTDDHPLLSRARSGTGTKWRTIVEERKYQHTSARLQPGDVVRFTVAPWEENLSYEDGWFCGILDGEGSLRAKDGAGLEMCVSQVAGEVLDRATRYLADRGFSFRIEVDSRKPGESSKFVSKPVYKLVISRIPEVLLLLGRLRPSRFISRESNLLEGKELPSNANGWVEVRSIEPLGEREMVDIETSTGTFIAEGFVTHNCSTVIEGLIAWSCIFFSNRQAIVVSHNDTHAAYLFKMCLDFYDHLPWWLKPMWSSRKRETGLELANPKLEERGERPGNNSLISVQSAAQLSGVGQGMKLNAVHCSEYSDWPWEKFHEIIDGDLVHAIADNINSFAFLESTGKGAGSPSEEMWVSQVSLAEEAEWIPLFIPWFFETTRVLAPEQGWKPFQPEVDMRDKVSRDWVCCDNKNCGQYFESVFRRVSRVNVECPECKLGKLLPVVLSSEQLRFMQKARLNAESKGPDSVKKLREELSTTAEEAWQLSGIQVFGPDIQEFVNLCVDRNPVAWGNIDARLQIHYVANSQTGECGIQSCKEDHRWDPEHPLQVWEFVDPNARYCVGIDVAEGLGGKSDFSVIWVNKYYLNGRGADEQVAMWRSNTVDPIALAAVINYIGRYYNNALVCVEVNKFDACDMALRMHHLYPNPFVWKHYDSKNPLSNKLGWFTNLRTKPMLWQTAVRWLRGRMWICKAAEFAHEIKRFQKSDEDDVRASAERNYHDDTVMAGMICLFCAHDMDVGEEMNYIPVPNQSAAVPTADWTNSCSRCRKQWCTESPARKCAFCRNMAGVQSHRNINEGAYPKADFSQMGKNREEISEELENPEQRRQFEEDSIATH